MGLCVDSGGFGVLDLVLRVREFRVQGLGFKGFEF
jgi:hypothetical protein